MSELSGETGKAERLRVGIDTGGTFTDLACLDKSGIWRRWKLPSTPNDPSRAIVEGLTALLPGIDPDRLEIVHGTTVGTNAFLERKGARTALITTAGFEDILFIGRQARPRLYDFMVMRPAEIIPRQNILGVRERMDWKGNILTPLTGEEIARAKRFCQDMGAESIAVCLLHAYANPAHERALQEGLSDIGIPVSLSSQVLPEFREYERLSTTLVNAYLGPVVCRYVTRLERTLPGARIFIQQSNGGCMPSREIGEKAVCTLLSGPAAGVQAAWSLGIRLGLKRLITLDMGGTSTDVSLCAEGPVYTRDYRIEGYPVAIPMLDIHTVGAGGGSLAWVDQGGLLKVGPESAGADPGPVCYGKGENLTVTDANLFLGRLRPEHFLGGKMALYPERVWPRMARLGERIGLSPIDTAKGIIRLVNINMVHAIRAVSLERGHDPRDFSLVCFGGAAGLHAADLAMELEIPRVVIPSMAGVFSAQGMAGADIILDGSEAFLIKKAQDRYPLIAKAVDRLGRKIMHDARTAGANTGPIAMEPFLDARYKGQSFEITIPFSRHWTSDFAAAHSRLYGYHMPETDIEITALRLRARIKRKTSPAAAPLPANDAHSRYDTPVTRAGKVLVEFGDGQLPVPLIYKRDIDGAAILNGPMLVIDDFTTILLPPGWTMTSVDGNLILEPRSSGEDTNLKGKRSGPP